MTDEEYSKLRQFADQYENFFEGSDLNIYDFINSFKRTHIIYCEQCRFHNDCNVEKILPGEPNSKFCSYAKENYNI